MSRIPPQYPPSLKNASIEEKTGYFRKTIVRHASLDAGLETLLQSCSPSSARRLILLIGGGGVGKSALQMAFANQRRQQLASEMVNDPWLVPSVVFEAKAPDLGPFKFDQIYESTLKECHELLVRRTQNVGRDEHLLAKRLLLEEVRRTSAEESLQERFFRCIDWRNNTSLGIDEAINIFKIGRPKSEKQREELLRIQGDKLKTIINLTRTSLILSGGYDFWKLAIGSSQLARRSRIVHVEPYFTVGPADLQPMLNFLDALEKLLAHLPIEVPIDPAKDGPELYTKSLAKVGMLKDLLNDGLRNALLAGVPLSIEVVRKGYLPKAQLELILNETKAGMAAMREFLCPGDIGEEVLNAGADVARATEAALKSRAAARRKLKPGETKPSHRKEASRQWNHQP